MIYTMPEIKKKINDAIPAGADDDIVRSTLLKLLMEKTPNNEEHLLLLFLDIVRGVGYGAECNLPAILTRLLAAVILSSTGKGGLEKNLDITKHNLASYYYTDMLKLLDQDKFSEMHQAELNNLAVSDTLDKVKGGDLLKMAIAVFQGIKVNA